MLKPIYADSFSRRYILKHGPPQTEPERPEATLFYYKTTRKHPIFSKTQENQGKYSQKQNKFPATCEALLILKN